MKTSRPAPTTVAEYFVAAHPKARAALVESASVIDRTLAAVARFERRKERLEKPAGTWDNARRWYPDAKEDADDFTTRVRSPSRAWPLSYYKAAMSLNHCLALDGGSREAVALLKHKVRGVDLLSLAAGESIERALLAQAAGDISDRPRSAPRRM